MSYHGDIALGNTIDIKFTTRQSTGVPTTLAGVPVISAYVGNGTTEITAGITLTVDFDARTGLNNVRVVASSGNGFATATDVELVITTGTVNSVSVVGEVIGSFSIENRSALRPATAGRTLVVDALGLADANAVKVGPTGAGTAQTARDLGASVLLAASQHVIVDSGTVTTLTNLPSIPANWLTAAGINAGALSGKGDWLLASGYTAPDNADIVTILANAVTLLSRIGASVALAGSAPSWWVSPTGAVVALDPAQVISSAQTDGTVGAALLGMEAQSVGKWAIVGTTLTLYRRDGTTAVRTFTLDSATAPTSRT